MWHYLELTNNQLMKRIMDAFLPKYIGLGKPITMAVFYSTDSTTGVTTLYFSPQASSLAMQFGASPFEASFNDMDLSLLVGDEGAIDALFPDADTH